MEVMMDKEFVRCEQCNQVIDFLKKPVKMELRKGNINKKMTFCSWGHTILWATAQTTDNGELKPLSNK